MKLKSSFLMLLLAATAFAGQSSRQSGVLLQMDSVQCAPEDSSQNVTGKSAVLSASTSTSFQEAFCQEYVLQSDRVTFHIRPSDKKNAVLLPIGGIALFRLQRDKMLLRAADLDDRDREYVVVSMSPREPEKVPDTPLPKLNHLQ
jgi:hypothetical protein